MLIHHEHFYFDKLEALDPVSVHLEIYPREDQQNPLLNAPFHIDIRCFGEIWTTFFSGPSGTPTQFIRGCGIDYLINKMHDQRHKTKASHKIEREYLRRIITAVKPLLLDNKERQNDYCQKLIEQHDAETVDYKQPEQAPRFDSVVIVRFVGDTNFYGPATAEQFNWNHAEGIPNIDQFWIVPGTPADVTKIH